MNKYWMCWVEQRGLPTKKHDTLKTAKKEAARLARSNDEPVAILECIGHVRPQKILVEFAKT